LKNDGTVACWGQNTLQQLAVPPGLTSVTQISTSASHTCARKADAQVVCWGDNSKGQATVPPFKSGDRVIAGGYHTCAELSGTASCWGEDDYNQLKFATLNGVSRFELGYHFTCRLNNGKVDCWGDNSRGQTTVPQLSDSVLGLSVGGYHACVFDNDGVVTCWALGRSVPAGLNLLGKQSQTIVFTSSAPSPGRSGETYAVTATGGASGNPVLFSSLTPDICEVTGNSVALTSIGRCTIAANQAGSDQYARAAQVIQSFDVVPSLERIPSIGAGGIHSCALQPNGQVKCWGV
jgi:alpha-tubulin suppressor-like RCC1 family protein